MLPTRHVVLASGSARRLQILQTIGIDPIVVATRTPEKEDGASPHDLVLANAKAKAGAVSGSFIDSIIIGADTLVVAEGKILGKPADINQARQMLQTLSGKEHEVYTAICMIDTKEKKTVSGFRKTKVLFSALSDQEIDNYIATGEPLDKAGAYGIQGAGGLFVEHIEGDYGTVVGLSLPLLKSLANELALEPSNRAY